ncbi:MAG: hypothetical protein HFJ34_08840 [Clostridia bacterium]|nr:hypothetical protein [Clostridia bacterium]
MNNKCNNCAKFLTCNRKKCEKISFVKAEILDKPQKIERDYIYDSWRMFFISTISMLEAEKSLAKAFQKLKTK